MKKSDDLNGGRNGGIRAPRRPAPWPQGAPGAGPAPPHGGSGERSRGSVAPSLCINLERALTNPSPFRFCIARPRRAAAGRPGWPRETKFAPRRRSMRS